jgi:hypothetical protein
VLCKLRLTLVFATDGLMQLIRQIIENELEQQRLLSAAFVDESGNEARGDEQFEIILRPSLDLALELTIFHEENPLMREQPTEAATSDEKKFASIATKLCVSPMERRVVLSEDASVSATNALDTQSSTTETRRRPSQLRKSLSTDDIGTYNATNGWIVDKPMVKSVGSSQPKEYERVKVGDILEAVDSIATGA